MILKVKVDIGLKVFDACNFFAIKIDIDRSWGDSSQIVNALSQQANYVAIHASLHLKSLQVRFKYDLSEIISIGRICINFWRANLTQVIFENLCILLFVARISRCNRKFFAENVS